MKKKMISLIALVSMLMECGGQDSASKTGVDPETEAVLNVIDVFI